VSTKRPINDLLMEDLRQSGILSSYLKSYDFYSIVEYGADTLLLTLGYALLKTASWPVFDSSYLRTFYDNVSTAQGADLFVVQLEAFFKKKVIQSDVRGMIPDFNAPEVLEHLVKATKHGLSILSDASQRSKLFTQTSALNTTLIQAFAAHFRVVVLLWNSASYQAFFPEEDDVPILHLYHVSNNKFYILDHADLSKYGVSVHSHRAMASLMPYILHFPKLHGPQSLQFPPGQNLIYDFFQSILEVTAGRVSRSIANHYSPKIDPRNIGNLLCGHQVPINETLEVLQKATEGLILTNEYESFPSLVCTVCKAPLQDIDVINLLRESAPAFISARDSRREFYLRQEKERRQLAEGLRDCLACLRENKKETFVLCEHTCLECAYKSFIQRIPYCQSCSAPVTEAVVRHFDAAYASECGKCNKVISVMASVINSCLSHKICMDCLKVSSNQQCPVCSQNYSAEVIRMLDSIFPKCTKCIKQLPLEQRVCACSICIDCQREICIKNKSKSCLSCHCSFSNTPFREEISNQIDLLTRAERSSECKVCFGEFLKIDMAILPCRHLICKDCIQHYVEEGYFKTFEYPCPIENCGTLILYQSISKYLDRDLQMRFENMSLASACNLVDCPDCNVRYNIDPDWREFFCTNCSKQYCTKCLRRPHPDVPDCAEAERQLILLGLEQSGETISECPGCFRPYLKNKECDHVKCLESSCGVEFCFLCACIREPTMVHGNHYHRPDCKYYGAYDGPDLPRPDKCKECQKAGRLCARPPQLEVPRRFKRISTT